jgi:hypothetical protein
LESSNLDNSMKNIGYPNPAIRLLSVLAVGLLCGKAAAIELDLERCTLRIGQTTLKPAAVANPWEMEFRAGKQRFQVCETKIVKPKQGGEAGWTAASDDGRRLHWLAADENAAYLLGYTVDEDGSFKDYDFPPRLRRLDLKKGTWLPDVPLPSGKEIQERPGEVLAVLAENGKLVVMTSILKPLRKNSKETHDDRERAVDAYEVRCYEPDAEKGLAKPIWAKMFPILGERGYTGGYVWGIRPAGYAASAIQRLSWMDDRLLVCAEAVQPILCLNGDTGKELWQLERPWEFQRGFVGPSVWSHFISRFGIREHGMDGTTGGDAREVFERRFECALVAGPIAVPLSSSRRSGTHSIFLAVAKGPAQGWSGYLSDCVVYEFDDEGKPVSMAMLPQMVAAGHSIEKNGLIWRCQNSTFVKIAAAPDRPIPRMGGSGNDGLSHVQWLRRLSYEEPTAWLTTAKACDPVAFSKTHAFCLPGGGYVVRESDSIFRFPIAAVDLSTSLNADMVLDVPFRGNISIPTTNYSSRQSPDGTRSIRTTMHHEAAITGLTMSDGLLEIVLGTEKWAGSVKFDVSKVP